MSFKESIRRLVVASNVLDEAAADAVKAKKHEQACAKSYQEHVEHITGLADTEKTYLVELPTGRTAVTVRRKDEGNGFTVDVLSIEEA